MSSEYLKHNRILDFVVAFSLSIVVAIGAFIVASKWYSEIQRRDIEIRSLRAINYQLSTDLNSCLHEKEQARKTFQKIVTR